MIEVAPVPRTGIPPLLSLHQFLHRRPEASLGRLWYLEVFENPSGISIRFLFVNVNTWKRSPVLGWGYVVENWKPRKSVPKTVIWQKSNSHLAPPGSCSQCIEPEVVRRSLQETKCIVPVFSCSSITCPPYVQPLPPICSSVIHPYIHSHIRPPIHHPLIHRPQPTHLISIHHSSPTYPSFNKGPLSFNKW